MGNNESEINKKPYRWFEFKPYNIKENEDQNQYYYNSLTINGFSTI